MKKYRLLILSSLVILGLGLIFRLILTSQGNFLFNMDNARDYVDVREMVEMKKWRLIGQTSGIEGLFTGPGWYYLLVIPYLLGGGHPYAAVVLMIGLWLVGGGFLVWLLRSRGWLAVVMGGVLWSCAPYLILATSYSLNPNPVELLSPVLVFCLWRYLITNKRRYSLMSWGLTGVFFNFEMAAGFFGPVIIGLTMMLVKRWRYFWSGDMWLGAGVFGLFLIPQVLFELKYRFFMTQSVLNHFRHGSDGAGWFERIRAVFETYYQVLSGTLMNSQWLVWLFLISLVSFGVVWSRRKQLDPLLVVILAVIIGPLIGHLVIPIKVMPWHLGFWVGGVVLLAGYLFGEFNQRRRLWRAAGLMLAILVGLNCLISLDLNKNIFNRQPSNDPSVYANQIAAIEAVYEAAAGRNFKVYTYLPSVIDYSYQYLIWWHGYQRYGYLPLDYAYSPNKPEYIKQKNDLPLPEVQVGRVGQTDSNLIFLIKEPDEQKRRELWENQFKGLVLINIQWVGPLEVETRQEMTP